MSPVDKACEDIARNLGSSMRTNDGYGILPYLSQQQLASNLRHLAEELKKEILSEMKKPAESCDIAGPEQQ